MYDSTNSHDYLGMDIVFTPIGHTCITTWSQLNLVITSRSKLEIIVSRGLITETSINHLFCHLVKSLLR